MKKNWKITWAGHCELREKQGWGSESWVSGKSLPPAGVFMSLFIKLRDWPRQSLRHPHTHSETRDFTTGLSCVVLCCLNLMNTQRGSPSESCDGARVTGQQREVIGAVFCPSTLHPPELLSAQPENEAPEREERNGKEVEEQQGSQGERCIFRLRISMCLNVPTCWKQIGVCTISSCIPNGMQWVWICKTPFKTTAFI